MDTKDQQTTLQRRGERGAALITVLLTSLLMLAAGGALLLTTGISATNAVDATAEAQAYYAAEAGLHSALSVLRGNVPARDGMNLPAGLKMKANFRAALVRSTSNDPNDTAERARLSAWLPYNATSAAGRVSLDPGNANSKLSFDITVSDKSANPKDPSTDPDYAPDRLLITSTGYGPKGAVKKMEILLTAGAFDFDPPGAVTGLPDAKGQDMQFTIDNGHSGGGNEPRRPKDYSGIDAANPSNIKPAFAVGAGDLSQVNSALATLTGYAGNVNSLSPNSSAHPAADSLSNLPIPTQLQSAAAATDLVAQLREVAVAQNRVFSKGELDPSVNLGTPAQPLITFIDGDVVIDNQTSGAGLMVVQGEFRPRIGFDYKGLILVIGDNAKVRFDDHGNNSKPIHSVTGAIVVAGIKDGAFERSEFRDEDPDVQTTIQFDSSWVKRALALTGLRPLGIREL
jgi:hypothetical protein